MNGVLVHMSIQRRERSAALLRPYIHMLHCPLCHHELAAVNADSVLCTANHTFDYARQGYINVLTRPFNGRYDKRLFAAKREVWSRTGLYAPLVAVLREQLTEHALRQREPIHVLDAGAGEGSLLQQVTQHLPAVGWGMDIAKEGIAMASSAYDSQIWMVGDLACSPFADQRLDAVINILSPSNYEEFMRILQPGGRLIKVVPRKLYLTELRERLHSGRIERSNPEHLSLERFKEHFKLTSRIPLTYTLQVDEAVRAALVHMTPLSWHSSDDQLQQASHTLSQITIDVEIWTGAK
ncbi:23S rRNA (guanine(745)-N(1))-methyltransferase [Paenibacillus sp. JJ-223]|nr:23S rRNA (guanine(745)-N(1))-methyltransferase [Paenibacillus sp. JJ-223]